MVQNKVFLVGGEICQNGCQGKPWPLQGFCLKEKRQGQKICVSDLGSCLNSAEGGVTISTDQPYHPLKGAHDQN